LRLEIVGFGEFHPRQPNDSAEGRNANRRVAILVLEEIAPGAAATARVPDAQAQDADASGVATADASSAANRLLWRVPPAALDKTVLVRDRAKPQAKEPPPPSD
jgi:hypothetical protein